MRIDNFNNCLMTLDLAVAGYALANLAGRVVVTTLRYSTAAKMSREAPV